LGVNTVKTLKLEKGEGSMTHHPAPMVAPPDKHSRIITSMGGVWFLVLLIAWAEFSVQGGGRAKQRMIKYRLCWRYDSWTQKPGYSNIETFHA